MKLDKQLISLSHLLKYYETGYSSRLTINLLSQDGILGWFLTGNENDLVYFSPKKIAVHRCAHAQHLLQEEKFEKKLFWHKKRKESFDWRDPPFHRQHWPSFAVTGEKVLQLMRATILYQRVFDTLRSTEEK